jgi:hypothetical protein
MSAQTVKKQKKPVRILVNNREVTLPDRDVTGAQIKEAAGVPLDFKLYRHHGDQLELVDNEERIRIHAKQKFTAVSGQDVS